MFTTSDRLDLAYRSSLNHQTPEINDLNINTPTLRLGGAHEPTAAGTPPSARLVASFDGD